MTVAHSNGKTRTVVYVCPRCASGTVAVEYVWHDLQNGTSVPGKLIRACGDCGNDTTFQSYQASNK